MRMRTFRAAPPAQPRRDPHDRHLPRGAPVYVICAAGGRSAQGAAFLTQSGVDAVNVTGGMTAWQQAGLPTIRDGVSA